MDADIRDLQRWLNRHLVSMVLIYWHLDEKGNSEGKPLIAACSGFVMTFGEAWFLATAGHVLKELDELIAHPFVKVVDSFLVDSLGSQATHKDHIPFTYEENKRGYAYADGLDYGLVALSYNDRLLLEANGIVPVAIENWLNQDIDRCKGFALIGIPMDWVSHERRGTSDGLVIGALLASVKRLHEPPPGADEVKYERFMGELSRKMETEHGLEGASGGPIVGFYDDEQGKLSYWVVALQSKCIDKRYILGCPVKLFGQQLLDGMREYIERLESRQGIAPV